MTAPELKVFDFRDIAALDNTAVSFRNWVAKSSSFFSDFWSDVSDISAPLSLGPISTESYGSLLESVPNDSICCLADFDGYASSVWFASPEELRIIVAESLCLSDVSELAEGELSPVELSLAQLFVDHLASALCDGWMGDDEVVVKASRLEKDPRKTRVFRAKDLVTKTSIEIDFKIGKVKVHWLLPKQQTCELLETAIDQRKVGDPVSPSEQMVGQLPIEIVSILGKATVPMSELAQLSVGALIVLDQRIDRPVIAYVNEAPYYGCWPGQLGKKQALEIAKCLNH